MICVVLRLCATVRQIGSRKSRQNRYIKQIGERTSSQKLTGMNELPAVASYNIHKLPGKKPEHQSLAGTNTEEAD